MNSMDYLEYAVSLPIDVVEVDIRKGLDGGLVLSHNPVFSQKILKLDDAFCFLSNQTKLINCDLKEYYIEDDVLSCAERHGIAFDRITFTGSVTDCMNIRKKHPMVNVFINAEELEPDFYGNGGISQKEIDNLIRKCRVAGFDVINIDYRACSELLLEKCIESGIKLSLWTVDDIKEVEMWSQQPMIENITTNIPDRVCSFLRKAQLKN